MTRARVLIAGGLLGTLAVLAAGILLRPGDSYAYVSTVFDPPTAAADIRLTEADGTPFVLSEATADLVVVYFGYTHCPDVCPTTMTDLHGALDRVPEDRRDDVQVVMVTIDPERDTPEIMGRYVAYFDDSFVGLSGPPVDLHKLMEAWDIRVQRDEAGTAGGDYFLSHPADTYVVDPQGLQLVMAIPFGLSAEATAEDLLHILDDH
jgi:protein SCO1